MDARRIGLPLSVKLMLTTSIVVAAAVAISAWYGRRTIGELTQDGVAARRAAGEAAIVRESELLARNIATAAAIPMAQQAFAEIGPLIAATRREYPRLQWIAIASEGRLVAATDGAPTVDFSDFAGSGATVEHRRLAPDRPDWIYGATIRLGEQPLGQLRIGVSTADLDAELAAALASADARAKASMQTVLLVALALLGVGVAVAAWQGIRAGRPLRALATSAERIAAGDLHQRVDASRGDEIGALARNFNFMADRLGQLMAEQAAKASMERELALARSVQQGMLPPPDVVEHGRFRVIGHCEPASSCGGDWWTYRRLANGRLLIVIGDATGHGVHSAIVAGTARGAVEALAEADERLLTPDQILRSIDGAIRNVGEENLLMTAFVAVFDPATGSIQYANAGQNFPYLMHMEADRRLDKSTIIAASGNPLGDRLLKLDIRRGSLQLRPGDLFVAFTDGLVERQAPSGKLFGDRRLRSLFTGRALAADGAALTALRDDIRDSVEAFAAGTVAQDDITFVLCHYDPPGAEAVGVAG
ncbi:MAG: SpoIIE family protein phosphatase [Kofleriaceae bacterium]|nr:SpoIIE family protein phosphatase [Kofleriaceae bacterium]MBP9172620.1 SpoIIE family protein phosphatase [Kofleriaceae bacterium]MBP9861449.1 SpoIIE family protein phosphatase [Kofleriaceae bacterium]